MRSLANLDEVDLDCVFEIRASVMKTVPRSMRGVFRGAIKTCSQAIIRGRERNDFERKREDGSCCWCLDCSSPDHHAGGWSRKDVSRRVWPGLAPESSFLLEMSLECFAQGHAARSRRRGRTTDDLQRRAGRALGLTQMGKLSHARRALQEEAVALGSEKTWKALTDKAKRPRISRGGVDQDLLDMNPAVPVDLDVDLLL